MIEFKARGNHSSHINLTATVAKPVGPIQNQQYLLIITQLNKQFSQNTSNTNNVISVNTIITL